MCCCACWWLHPIHPAGPVVLALQIALLFHIWWYFVCLFLPHLPNLSLPSVCTCVCWRTAVKVEWSRGAILFTQIQTQTFRAEAIYIWLKNIVLLCFTKCQMMKVFNINHQQERRRWGLGGTALLSLWVRLTLWDLSERCTQGPRVCSQEVKIQLPYSPCAFPTGVILIIPPITGFWQCSPPVHRLTFVLGLHAKKADFPPEITPWLAAAEETLCSTDRHVFIAKKHLSVRRLAVYYTSPLLRLFYVNIWSQMPLISDSHMLGLFTVFYSTTSQL